MSPFMVIARYFFGSNYGGIRNMCEYVLIPQDVEEQMKELYMQELYKEYYKKFERMTKDKIKANKNKHKVVKSEIKGLKGEHEIIYGTIDDAKEMLPIFVNSIGSIN